MAEFYTEKDAIDAIRANDERFEPRQELIPAMLGNGSGVVVVPNRGSNRWCFARPRGSGGSPMVVYNGIAPTRSNWPVIISEDPTHPGQFVVVRTQSLVPGQDVFNDNGTAPHHLQHTFGAVDADGEPIGGDDTVFARFRQMADGRVSPTVPASMTVSIVDSIYDFAGTIEYYPGGTLDLTAYVPASGAVWVTISLGANASVHVTASAITYAPDTRQIPQAPHVSNWRIAAVLLLAGQTEITDWPEPDQSIFDLRFVQSVTSSTHDPGAVQYLDDLLDVSVPEPLDGQSLVYDAATTAWDAEYLLYSFLSLIDTPASYVGQANRVVSVRNDETGLQFVIMSAGGGGNPLLFVDGTLVVATEIGAYVATSTSEIDAVYIYCKASGSSGTTTVDIHLNGVTIFTAQANRPQLVWNDLNKVAKSGTPDIVDLVENDVLTADIDQVAVGAASLTVIIAMVGGGGGGVSTFDALSDTPVSKTGQAGKVVAVSGGEVNLEYVTPVSDLGDLDDVNVPAPNDDDALIWDSGAGKWVASPPVVGGQIWHPDVPPASASALDDEFSDGSVSGSWTEHDSGGLQTPSEDDRGLILTQSPDAGDDITGVYKAIPSGDFTIVTKVSLISYAANYAMAGLALWQDATAGSDVWIFDLQFNEARMQVLRFSSPQTFAGNTYNSATELGVTHAYLRIRRAGTTYSFEWGTDGIGWLRGYSGVAPFVPTLFGPCINCVGLAIDAAAAFKFFRYKDSDVGLMGILYGGTLG